MSTASKTLQGSPHQHYVAIFAHFVGQDGKEHGLREPNVDLFFWVGFESTTRNRTGGADMRPADVSFSPPLATAKLASSIDWWSSTVFVLESRDVEFLEHCGKTGVLLESENRILCSWSSRAPRACRNTIHCCRAQQEVPQVVLLQSWVTNSYVPAKKN